MTNPLFDQLFGIHSNNKDPFIHSDDGTVTSYQQFLERTAQYANTLSANGLVAGDRLVSQVGKSTNSLALYASCAQSGVVYLPLNTSYTSTEVEYFVSDSEASLLVCDPTNESAYGEMARRLGIELLSQSANGLHGSFVEQANKASNTFDTVAREEQDIAALLYTSGTTGRSKGAMLTQENLLSNAITLKALWQFEKDDVLLHALPVYHTHGLFVATNTIALAGAQMLFEKSFDIDRMIQLMPKANTMMGVPTFYTRLLNDERFTKDLTKHMRLFVSGSAPLLAETHQQFEQRTGHRVLERYGMTETNMNTSNPYDGERKAGTVGFPLPGVDVKVTDAETGKELPSGEIGQLEVRGPNVFKGYWNMPEKTALELRDDGYFITGDLGVIDEDGYVSIVGRDKDLIISGGFNIYPKELELLLDEQEGVLESAVIGVPHADFGETAVAILVAEEHQSNLDMDEIESAVSKQLARFKHPRKFIQIDSLPRNTMGKVQKNLLRDTYADIFSS